LRQEALVKSETGVSSKQQRFILERSKKGRTDSMNAWKRMTAALLAASLISACGTAAPENRIAVW